MAIWAPVLGYEETHKVSTVGDVESLPRQAPRTDGRRYSVRGRILKPHWNGGHYQVERNGQPRYIHVLMLEAFVSPRPEGMKGLHRDDDPRNNVIENLYWGTMQDNAFDRVRNGHDFCANKVVCKRGHLLDHPNLVPWGTMRACWACNRAVTHARWLGRKGDQEFIQELSNEKYAAIVGAA
jgi:hypothetical protein